MIKRKIGQSAILNRLEKLKQAQERKDQIDVVIFDIEDDGRISTFNLRKQHPYFENMFEAENFLCTVPGITKNTAITIDDMCVFCDLYLPTEPILYFCNSAERREFIAGWENPSEWMEKYIGLIQRVLALAIEKPNMSLPGFDDPALQDLINVRNSMGIEQLIERYKDKKWFVGNKK